MQCNLPNHKKYIAEDLLSAANSIGLDGDIHLEKNKSFSIIQPCGEYWNPLNSDIDTELLNIALRQSIIWFRMYVYVGVSIINASCEFFSDHDDDKMQAMRYASVRAAARLHEKNELRS